MFWFFIFDQVAKHIEACKAQGRVPGRVLQRGHLQEADPGCMTRVTRVRLVRAKWDKWDKHWTNIAKARGIEMVERTRNA